MALNTESIRKDFPMLSQGIVYLDSAASSLTPEPVLAKELEYYRTYRANIHRGVHRWSERASQEYEAVYGKLRTFFRAPKDGMFISTRNTTEAINGVALGLKFSPEQNIVTTSIEHHSNLLPWVRLERQGRIKELRIVSPTDPRVGQFSIDDFAKAIDSKTALVAVTASSNVLGCRPPIYDIIKLAHNMGAKVLVDAAQWAGHGPMDFARLGADFVAFSGHKMLAPTGIGALYMEPHMSIEPWFVGGGTIRGAELHDYTLLPAPESLEGGTPNIAGWIALGAALDYLSRLGLEAIAEHETRLAQQIADGLRQMGCEVYGPLKRENGVVAFNVPGVDAHQVAAMADELKRVAIRSGHHCAMPLTHALGVKATVRASVHAYNNERDVAALLDAIKSIRTLSH